MRSTTSTLDIRPGELVSLIGPSGCGKSTLLRIIGDLIEPTRGEVKVGGKSAHQARLDRDYGMVFQEAVLYDWRNVAKNIALPLEMLGWSRGERQARVGRWSSSSSWRDSRSTILGSSREGCRCASRSPARLRSTRRSS